MYSALGEGHRNRGSDCGQVLGRSEGRQVDVGGEFRAVPHGDHHLCFPASFEIGYKGGDVAPPFPLLRGSAGSADQAGGEQQAEDEGGE